MNTTLAILLAQSLNHDVAALQVQLSTDPAATLSKSSNSAD
jgi:hypothetical protein